MIPQYRPLKSKLPKYRLKKLAQYRNTVNPHVPLFQEDQNKTATHCATVRLISIAVRLILSIDGVQLFLNVLLLVFHLPSTSPVRG